MRSAVHRDQLPRSVDLGELPAVLLRCLEGTATPMAVTDARRPDQPIVWVNAAFELATGYWAEQVVGRNARFLQGPDTDAASVHSVGAAVYAERSSRTRVVNYRPDGTSWVNEMHVSPIRDRSGTLTHWLGVSHDVTDQVALERAAEYAATRDPLTGLANRVSFTGHLQHELGRSRRDRRAVAVLFLDVDGFKAVNDTFGHAAGDELLVQLADRLTGRLRAEDLVARLGGDEFLAMVVDLTDDGAKAAATVVGDIQHALTEPFALAGGPVTVGVSVGVALHPRDGSSAQQLIAAADTAMYRVKAARPKAHLEDA